MAKGTAARHDIVVLGGSAGGVEAVREVVAGLPADLVAAVFVVVHMPAFGASHLPEVLERAGPLRALHPRDGDTFQPGTIYIAPPDHHLLLDGPRVLVRRGPKENRFRPSIDALFRSAAYGYGPRVIGAVLSGALDDGVSGLWSIKRLGGISIVQHPDDAVHSELPRAAIEQVAIDHVVTAQALGPLLARLASEHGEPVAIVPDAEIRRLGQEIDIAARDGAFDSAILKWGDIAPFTCPDCHGALVRLDDGSLLRFRCHSGHAFTPRALLAGISEAIESTFGQALRCLDEQTQMLAYLGEHGRRGGRTRFDDNARASELRTGLLHESLAAQRQLSAEIADELDTPGDGERGE